MNRPTSACGDCLRRADLLGWLSPRIAATLGQPKRDKRAARPILHLSDHDLIAAVAPRAAGAFRDQLESWEEEHARAAVEAAGAVALCRHAGAFPPQLLDLFDPPAAIFAKGRLELLEDRPRVTIVGGRRASTYALDVTYTLARGLAAAGVTVVSGLALGADAEAHRGALDAGGGTIAVLPRGVDGAYPRFNRSLYERTCETGLVLSELPPGSTPHRWSFPARNRLMAALGDMTVVTEAGDPSGSLITSDFAMALGKEVGAVPGRVTATCAAGTNRLLREGVAVVRSAQDVLDELFGADGSAPQAVSRVVPEELRSVLEAVEAADTLAGVARAAGVSAGAARSALCRLELLGLVRRSGLTGYERAAG